MKSALRTLLVAAALLSAARGEPMLQYFNTSWKEIEERMPELAEAGYGSLWLPPPTKASGGLSVGYDLWDRFDLGSKDQRGTVSTRYGTEADLQSMMRTAHRFGIRVYFDNIMNHNAFDTPAFDEFSPIDIYPGFVPEDFHLRITEEGYFRKWDNTRNWSDAWQVMNLGLADLIDIAQEPGGWNDNFGPAEGGRIRKIRFLRHPSNPEYYCYKPSATGQTHARNEGTYVGFGPGNGLTPQFLAANADFYSEYVEELLHRAARWKMDRTRADGLRLDAVKHVRDDFFGASGAGKDSSNYGYTGQVQAQFNLSRGFSDWGNHRDSVFDTERGRDDAMVFGEHLGQPPGYGGYIERGMRLVDNDLRSNFNNLLGNPSSGLQGFDQPGSGGMAAEVAVTHAQSHDSDYAARRELQHAFYFTRAGLPLVYTDGNYNAPLLNQSGGAFPRHSNTAFLGQFADPRLPNLMQIHQNFSRGSQVGAWGGSADLVAYERIDRRNNPPNNAAAAVALVMINDNYASGVGQNFSSSFPPGAHLYQYARGPAANGQSLTGFYITLGDAGGGRGQVSANLGQPNGVIVPPGGYFVFSWKNPDPAPAWANAGGPSIEILQNGGDPVPTVMVERRDGPDGDPAFNPYGLPDADPTDRRYSMPVPRVTNGSNLSFRVRADGSAENILLKLDGGIDLNNSGSDPAKRDNPPGLSNDIFLGYEQADFHQRVFGEKFAAVDTTRNKLRSPGAETYSKTIGSGAFTINNGPAGANNYNNQGGDIASFLYHDPAADVGGIPAGGWPGGAAPKQYTEGADKISVWAKPNGVGANFKMFLYYTVDGTFPEGAAGSGAGTTRALEMFFRHNQDGNDWWMTADLPKPAAGATLRYKIGIFKHGANSWFPADQNAVSRISSMLTEFRVENFNATTVSHFPHNDYARIPDPAKPYAEWAWDRETGLEEGFHVVRARAFLNRGNAAPVYNTFTRTFYYDAQRPAGEIVFPAQNDTLGQQSYGVVVRTDRSVKEVWYRIEDSDTANDDTNTRVLNGNGTGFEPFTDSNNNGIRDPFEPFEDTNGNGTWDDNLTQSWVRANPSRSSLSIQSPYPLEWRFDYRNIPASGQGVIRVRLREISSSTDHSLSDTAGHFTTLQRTVNTNGPETRLFVAYPQADGNTVGDNYVLKAFFSKNLGDGVSDAQLINEFTVRIDSSGDLTEPVAQDRSAFSIVRNETDRYHALAFPIPSLYNGVPDFLHRILVSHQRSGITLTASRSVLASPSERPFLSITTPPVVGSDGRPYEIVLPARLTPTAGERSTTVRVDTDNRVATVTVTPELGGGSIEPLGMTSAGSTKTWEFRWSNLTAGRHRIRADARLTEAGAVAATATRDATVVIRQSVLENADDEDDDDDGLPDSNELTRADLPETASATWTNGDVHFWLVAGRTNPVGPDTDDDGMPDGLEAGIRTAFSAGTDTATDTDGDGWRNFIADADPPIYNTSDNSSHPRYDVNRSRTDQIGGSLTDASKPDTDGDSLDDGPEDTNRNGRVDIALLDGSGSATSVMASPTVFYNTSRVDSSALPANAVFLETDPNNPDTDGDGASDGAEDEDLDGQLTLERVDAEGSAPQALDLTDPANGGLLTGSDLPGIRSRRINRTALDAAFPPNAWPRVLWKETDPLSADTDGDGLSDGWERVSGLDPLDNGTRSLRSGGTGDPDQGAAGDPDNDGFTNLQELQAGTKPLVPDTTTTPPANSITIGPGTPVSHGSTVNDNAFTDWTGDDIVSFDEFEGNGPNNSGGDVYQSYDGYDSSRDITAFYARDGGADGNYYFRLDFHDLKAGAEEGSLDIYVVVDSGNPASGESALPDEVDILTNMKWEAVIACYQSDAGRVYIDTNPGVNSTTVNQALAGANGVISRDQNAPNGFGRAYFNHELDAVEFSISRAALTAAGWNGSSKLNFQVFTTRDGTGNSSTNGNPGPGDLGGRNDIRDTITDDWLADEYWSAQSNIITNGRLYNWIGADGSGLYPDQRKSAKLMLLAHGHQPLLPGAETQRLLNSGFSTGYHRPVAAHLAFAQPLTLHITPTLASALQWAAADPAAGKPWRDGPTFNTSIADALGEGLFELTGSTVADHKLAYFSNAFNADNTAAAATLLTRIYGTAPSSRTLWNPGRVADSGVLQGIAAIGYDHTFIDQMRHLLKWQGRSTALSDDGYRINRFHGVNCFTINDQASGYRFQNADSGLAMPLRNLFHRKARSGTQDQVVIIQSDWEDFLSFDDAAAYDRNLRWIANRPWIRTVTPGNIIRGEIDINRDGAGDSWYVIDRGSPALAKVSQDEIDHATQENYDNWYLGQEGREEGLFAKVFEIRPGTPLPASRRFGMQALADNGLADLGWDAVSSLGGSTPASLSLLARSSLHAATASTALHNQSNNDLSNDSTGAYTTPDTDYNTLSSLSKRAQSQIRFAEVYKHVAAWNASPPSSPEAVAADVDLDGEQEYILRNTRVFAVFEALGGRMTASWARNESDGTLHQMSGPLAALSDQETEWEGISHDDGTGGTGAHRTSGFKDWFVVGPGTNSVNALYTATASGPNGWTFASPDGRITKTLSLEGEGPRIRANYTLGAGATSLFIRFGLSPHLEDLLASGQRNLTSAAIQAGTKTITNSSDNHSAAAALHTLGTGLSGATVNALAIDDAPSAATPFAPDTFNMRNQALTEQVEVQGMGANFSFELELLSGNPDPDQDGDGLPDDWEQLHGLSNTDDGSGNPDNGAAGDPDKDGMSNMIEWLVNLNPVVRDLHLFPKPVLARIPGGTRISFPTLPGRTYQLQGSANLSTWTDVGDPVAVAADAAPSTLAVDDSPATPPRFYRMTIRKNP